MTTFSASRLLFFLDLCTIFTHQSKPKEREHCQRRACDDPVRLHTFLISSRKVGKSPEPQRPSSQGHQSSSMATSSLRETQKLPSLGQMKPPEKANLKTRRCQASDQWSDCHAILSRPCKDTWPQVCLSETELHRFLRTQWSLGLTDLLLITPCFSLWATLRP